MLFIGKPKGRSNVRHWCNWRASCVVAKLIIVADVHLAISPVNTARWNQAWFYFAVFTGLIAKWTSATIIIKKVPRRGHTCPCRLRVLEHQPYACILFASLGNPYVVDPICYFRWPVAIAIAGKSSNAAVAMRSLHLVEDAAITAKCLPRLAPVRARMLWTRFYALVGRLFLYSNPKPDTPRWVLHVQPGTEPGTFVMIIRADVHLAISPVNTAR